VAFKKYKYQTGHTLILFFLIIKDVHTQAKKVSTKTFFTGPG